MSDKGKHVTSPVFLRQILVAAALVLAAAPAAAQGTKIGFVNPSRVENEAVPFVRALEALKKEFEPRTKPVVELQKQISDEKQRYEKEEGKLSPSEKIARQSALSQLMRKSDQMVEAITEDFERRKAERAVKLLAEVNAVIRAVAEAGKFDLIVQQATFAGKGIDITDQVIQELAKRSGGKP
jgi:outer membrane protein